ncbi:hypothetical protein [Clostridium butyricum]|uniref:hypothetical protein n=1 Tax=Clostridium butyricum TaxID=1492 RepID=UPI0006E685EE|nr:hypothetical protein AK964_21125 [Clostridium butyricum]
MDIINNIINNIISSTIGGFIAIFIAIWQLKKQIKLNVSADKKKQRLFCKKVDLYFSGIESIFKTTNKDNMKNNYEFHISVTRKPQILKVDYNIINDLVELIGLISENEVDKLFDLHNKINETYNSIYNYDNKYTEDSSTEHTQGAEESEIVNLAISNLLKCFDENREILNKLKS